MAEQAWCNMDLLKQIQFNLDNLMFAIKFDVWDLQPDVQNRMLLKCDEIQGELNRVKESKR